MSDFENNNRDPECYVPRLMTDFIRRTAAALTNFLLTPLSRVGAARVRAPVGVGSRLVALALLLGASLPALAANCSDYPNGIIDGNFVNPPPSNIQIDRNCTIRNFQFPNLLATNFSFYTAPGQTNVRHLVIFDNVNHTGQMSCNATHGHKIWFTNGSSTAIRDGCQNLLIPVEKIDKQSPAAVAAVGVPFKYTLTIPVLFDPAGTGAVIDWAGSVNDLHGITITDDLNATGVDLSLVEAPKIYWKGSNDPITDYTFTNTDGLLRFEFAPSFVIEQGWQLVIELTVVLDDTPKNAPGTEFVNTAKWQFGRLIDGTFYDPLPGEWGISQPMRVEAPTLEVTKSSPATALNIGVWAPFTIDVHNTGGVAAWNVKVDDLLPDAAGAGMCEYDPRTVSLPDQPGLDAKIVAANGTLVTQLEAGSDYSVTYSGCKLSLAVQSDKGRIEPEQHLIITYQTQLDGDTTVDGFALTNVAGATEWYSADPNGGHAAVVYNRSLSSDGTPGVVDHEDSHTVYTGLSGYYFEKIVANLTAQMNPASTAAPGDTLRYKVRLFNVDQTIDGITITDPLDSTRFDLASFAMVTLPAGAAHSFNQTTGVLTVSGGGAPLNVSQLDELVIEFDITLRGTLVNGDEVLNQATLTADQGTPGDLTDDFSAVSDDPYINGVAAPDVAGDEDQTRIVIQTPGPLEKANPSTTNVTIGEQFAYTVTVTAPAGVPLYDVRIVDTLPSSVDLRVVSARLVSDGRLLSHSVSGSTLVVEDAITGIDIPAGGTAVVEITVELENTSNNNAGETFTNSATYTYNRVNGGGAATERAGAGATTPVMTVVEPTLTAAKGVSFVTPAGKTGAATVGDVLEYTVTMANTGTSIAFDASVVDALPDELELVAGSATASIDGGAVVGFVATPTVLPDGSLAWGAAIGDGSLDVAPGDTLTLTYRATVVSVSGAAIVNGAHVDWTSLQGGQGAERTGAGCPSFTAPDDYCAVAPPVSVSTVDNTVIAKAVVADTYAEDPPAPGTADPIVRVGDTVTYELTLNLQEYTTRNVVVTDVLPAGMALESFEILPTPGTAPFSYTMVAQPTVPSAPGATLTWNFGDIVNAPNGSPVDQLVIRYVARVVTDLPSAGVALPSGAGVDASILRTNTAQLAYTGGDPATYPDRLTAAETIDVRQPQMGAITKVDQAGGRVGSGTSTDPYQVDIASDVMNFRLSSCNGGLAPAYGVVITDTLASQFNMASLSGITVRANGVVLAATDYTYTPAGNTLNFTLATGVNPGQCVTVDYNVGFNTDVAANQTWSNQAQLTQYESLPVLTTGRLYTATDTAQVWMTNLVTVAPLTKVLTSATEATVGETVTYQITVPGTAMNAALADVVVADTLHGALEYVSATATVNNVARAVGLTQNGQDLSLALGNLAAGEQAIVTLTARVANNDQANAGTVVANAATYSYTGMPAGSVTTGTSAPFTIVEPLVTVAKDVPAASPQAGDLITYTVSLTAAGGVAGDVYANAFDLAIEDRLGLGLVYEPNSAKLNGAPLANPSTNGGDGVTTAQTLTWDASVVDLDLAEGTNATVTYQVRVLGSVVPGQSLTNSVVARWTGLDGDQSAVNERTGSGGVNDYFTQPVTTELWIGDSTSIAKSVYADSYPEVPASSGDPVVRVGDTVTYDLTLNLQEGTTQAVVVTDVLPAGLALESFTVVPGATGGFSSTTPVSAPAAGATGTLTWNFGDIVNAPNGSPVDQLVIRYVARVVTDAPPVGVDYTTSIPRTNTAQLAYTGGDPAAYPGRLTAAETIDVRQPQMGAITKVDQAGGRVGSGTSADPYQVDIASDVMNFRLSSCNDGLAPAYGVVITDTLASQFNMASLSGITVRANGTVLAAADYTYTPAGNTLSFTIATGVNPGQCVTVDYNVGFNTDVAANQTWSNQAQLTQYASLPASGRVYTAADTAQVWMTNLVTVAPLTKTLTSATEATVGQDVVYQITVPGTPMNAALAGVVVSDTLHGALDYVSATATVNGVARTVGVTASGQNLSLALGNLAAGEQAIVTLTARVGNNDQANAGTVVANAAAYSYTGMPAGSVTAATSAPFTIVEPLVTVAKSVPAASPQAGDLLTYTVSLAAAGGVAGDVYANAFDLAIEDSLGLGLVYEPGSATLNGAPLANPSVAGDGVATAQTLTWDASVVDIDLAEAATATVTYQVRVLGSVVPGQSLTNSVVARWTGLDGDQSAIERTGSGTPEVNDYFTQPATTTLMAPLAVTVVNSVVNQTTGQTPGANASPGDILHYTVVLTNESVVPVTNGVLTDVLAAQFVPGSLQIVSVSDASADSSNSNPSGGANGTGSVDIRNLTLAAQGDPAASVTIEFIATLAAVIPSGTTVIGQAELTANNLPAAASNEARTLIASTPQLVVKKISQDLTGDPNVLRAGDTLRYTITVQSTGSEDAVDVVLRDLVPTHTTYVAGSTRLNGGVVADAGAGVSQLQTGLALGNLSAVTGAPTNLATVTFDVVVNAGVLEGTIISNQGFVNGSGTGSGAFPEVPSDDPSTVDIPNDPTNDIVGELPLLDAMKTVALHVDGGTPDSIDGGDTLRYTIVVTNTGAITAADVSFTDATPAGTTYVPGSTMLGTSAVPDAAGGGSPLLAGIQIGPITPGASVTITFDVTVNNGLAAGTPISNQGHVATPGMPTEPTDADGNDANGDQPTVVFVGHAQQLAIVKEAIDLDGGIVEAGDTLEYVVRVTNVGLVTATGVVISDDLGALAPRATYVANSATINPAGSVALTGSMLAADVGTLAPGATATLRFRVMIATSVAAGTAIDNTATVTWNTSLSLSDSASVAVGTIPGSATLGGQAWHDANFDDTHEAGEGVLSGWAVELYRGTTRLGGTTTDTGGFYRFAGVAPTTGADTYRVVFSAPGATATTARLGYTASPFDNSSAMQEIRAITAASNDNLANLNLPIDPNGVVYHSLTRAPIAGARLTMLQGGTPVDASCFADPAHQNQMTLASGFYKFEVLPGCLPAGETDFVIQVTPPGTGYEPGPSRLIPPVTHAGTAAFSVATCSPDAVATPAGYCEAQATASAPATGTPIQQMNHYLHVGLTQPGASQLFNNHIPLDVKLDEVVSISKVSSLVNVTRGQIVPYVITMTNTLPATLENLEIVDIFPPGFKYVAGSARVNGVATEPVATNRSLTWSGMNLPTQGKQEIKLLFIVGSGVGEGEYVNRALAMHTILGEPASGEATATVRVVPDPTFDCTDIIGKVFDDANRNGYQDPGEKGLPGVRVATARGLLVTTDDHGRFHVTCAVVPNEDRGSNFILKVDDRTLPTGYRITTENPRVQRVTRGKMAKFNFGAAINKMVRLDVANGVFEPGTTEMRIQWKPRVDLLLGELKKGPSILRLAYMAEIEDEKLVEARLKAMKQALEARWAQEQGPYELVIETEVFWRTGAPPARSARK